MFLESRVLSNKVSQLCGSSGKIQDPGTRYLRSETTICGVYICILIEIKGNF